MIPTFEIKPEKESSKRFVVKPFEAKKRPNTEVKHDENGVIHENFYF